MRKWVKRVACAIAIVLLGVLVLVIFGGFRLKDPQGNVAFGWDSTEKRFLFLEKPRLGPEGPHAFVGAGGYEVLSTQRSGDAWRLARTHLPPIPLPTLIVRVDNPMRTTFKVPLRPATSPAIAVHDQNPSRLLMLSDMEGQFNKFVELLRAQRVIDDDLHWKYGDGHVALVGDFVDRGKDMTALLWLIYRLDGEADAAGGQLHYVLGNHEHLAMSGRKKYWPQGLIAFAQTMGEDGDERLFSSSSVLGAWLARQPIIARVGDHLLVHGGISAEFLALNLDIPDANAKARPHLHTPPDQLPEAVAPLLGKHGLTWYRGMALPEDPEKAIEIDPAAHLQRVLSRYGARRMVIGHSLVDNITLEQVDLLLRLDIHHAQQTPQAALYEDGVLWRVGADGSRVRLK